ncbi:hypothetical protein CFP56_025689 [Quercus suber]|uniref:Uncharacterized protein n=2 Tax=Quercus suber TaxID=58331 RepID=A0AAW0K2X6_QUESU
MCYSKLKEHPSCFHFSITVPSDPKETTKQSNCFASFALSPPMAKKPASSILDTLKRYIKKPWEFTGPQSHPEYRNSILPATQYRVESPASTKVQPWVPTSNPETVFDIKYYTRDQRRNRPPIRRTVLKKADVEKLMKETTFDVKDLPRPYLAVAVEEDLDTHGGGYQK